MKLATQFREQVAALSQALCYEIDQLVNAIRYAWDIEHNDDGTHKDIHATSLTIRKGSHQAIAEGRESGTISTDGTIETTGAGPHTFGGDVIAEFGSGTETGIGTLVDVNGVNAVAGLPQRHGILMGGTTDGFFIVQRARSGDFGGGANRELAIYDLANAPGTAPMLQLAQDTALGNYVWLDGGAGSTKWQLGDLGRKLAAVFTDIVVDANGTHGAWTSVAFNAANFTGSGTLTWTLTSPDQITFAYTLINKTMTVAFTLQNTSVAGAGALLKIAIPGGFTAAQRMDTTGFALDNGVTLGVGLVIFTAAGGTVISIARGDGVNWTAAANTTVVQGQITFEVQ